jgi:hypothetical protein
MRFWIVDWSSIFHKVRLVRMNPKNEYKIAFNTHQDYYQFKMMSV